MPTLLRAAVMLTVLVAAPVLWIYRGPLPGPAQQTVDQLAADARAWWTGSSEATPTPTASLPAMGNSRTVATQPAGPVQAASAGLPEKGLAETELARRMEPLLVQLRDQGASEYSLESWGLAGRLFRFTCLLPIANNPDQVRQFEAIAEDPSVAVEQVLAEASQWRSARAADLWRR